MSLLLNTKPPVLNNNITRKSFLTHFPRAFKVRALDAFESMDKGLNTDVTQWEYIEPFEFVSDQWGSILIPAGFITDFASVPTQLHSVYDDDSPILLYPSAAHDLLFTCARDRVDLPFKPKDGKSRGWLIDKRQLTLEQTNKVLAEAMWYCGADSVARSEVFGAVQVANLLLAGEFAAKPAKPNSGGN